MLKSHAKFHSEKGKRLLLIVDDEPINREMLGAILEEEYEILLAENGQQALDMIYEHKDTLSLVLLDLIMPVMTGLELLEKKKADPDIQSIPVIVVTSDQTSEVQSLQLGALDFIPKPYPQADVIQARILRIIELSEDRQIIQSTERDPLTGLYNWEFFYRYAEQFDQYHKRMEMDAIVLDVNHFHTVSERYGKPYGDEILRRIGKIVRNMVQDSGGIVSRREADTFLIYCPHRTDYKEILENATRGAAGNEAAGSRIRLRMGVYSVVDKEIDVERRFDRAKMAADTVRNSHTNNLGIYDSTLQEKELYTEQLIDDFHKAIRDEQFLVFYQPKFNVRSEIPILAGAEALVRWKHPQLGMISPGVFIPLFEDNGLIQELDRYVWRKAASQIRDWKNRFDFTVPVSVNMSRVDMYDPALIPTFQGILKEFDLTPGEFLLEITESAYTQDSEKIINMVNQLREQGFQIEMDDFGTGYSSLNMLSTLPIDALKLDMKFIRTSFDQQRDTRMLELVIDIAEYLSVPVIAKGVETEEQLTALKAMGCDIVQGYYFSKPVPPEEYEIFVAERKEQKIVTSVGEDIAKQLKREDLAYGKIAHALSHEFESIYYVSIDTEEYVEYVAQGFYENLTMEITGTGFFAECQKNLLTVVYPEDQKVVSEILVKERILQELETKKALFLDYRLVINSELVPYRMKIVLSEDSRHIVIGISNLSEEIEEGRTFESVMQDSVTYASIAKALAADYFSIYYVNMDTDRFIEYSSHHAYDRLGIEKRGENFFELSRTNILRMVYPEDLNKILSLFTKDRIIKELEKSGTFTISYRLLFDGQPTYVRMKAIRMENKNDPHIVIGVHNVDAEMKREEELGIAKEKANRDALTGVKNKHAYVEMEQQFNERIAGGKKEPFAVVVCDLNDLKGINDTLGHTAGDQHIKDACMQICHIFQHSPVFRIGGDEFAVILRDSDFENREELMRKMEEKNREHTKTGGVIIASGISDFMPGKDKSLAAVFERADAAMYENKKQLKSTC